MYDIKKTILKMKEIAHLDSNADLARFLNISYNTLNTWIKRGKLPQETLYNFCLKQNCSLDYLIFDKSKNNLFNKSEESFIDSNIYTFKYYGKYFENYNKEYIELFLDRKKRHSNANFLLEKNGIYTIAICIFDIFNNNVLIKYNGFEYSVNIEVFNSINRGLILKYE